MMALLRRCLALLRPYLRDARVLSLGYPDLALPAEELESVLGVRVRELHPVTHWPETVHVFEQLGCSLDTVDLAALRGPERIVDLNLPAELGQYDLVLDAGTLEHCFNIGQAFANALAAVRPGGRIFHTPPLSMVNHGFFNLCPTLFFDLYTQNGWEIEHLQALRDLGRGEPLPVEHVKRCKAPPEAVLHVLARRTSDAPLTFPRQSKYMAMMAAAGTT